MIDDDVWLIVAILAATLSLHIHLIILDNEHQQIEPASTRGYINATFQSVAGLYIPGCGFFVDTRGSDVGRINSTVTHEAAHAYIYQGNYSHFCEVR